MLKTSQTSFIRFGPVVTTETFVEDRRTDIPNEHHHCPVFYLVYTATGLTLNDLQSSLNCLSNLHIYD
jgi:hypothetical protein